MPDRSVQQAAGLTGPLRLPDRPSAPREAREHLRHYLEAISVSAGSIDVILLLASEVVTNALRHAPPPGELRVHVVDGLVRIEVTDSHPLAPRRREPDAESPGGRGLWLLDALAVRWGHRRESEGKCVWFEYRSSESV
jgi:anti-sigma regulatory factor (Ser/Thr protein kinase)